MVSTQAKIIGTVIGDKTLDFTTIIFGVHHIPPVLHTNLTSTPCQGLQYAETYNRSDESVCRLH